MRTTEREISCTSAFKRDFKRLKKNDPELAGQLAPVLSSLALELPLEQRFHAHALTGDKKPFRDCHVRPDLILLYYKPDDDTLVLVRLGSHSELSLWLRYAMPARGSLPMAVGGVSGGSAAERLDRRRKTPLLKHEAIVWR